MNVVMDEPVEGAARGRQSNIGMVIIGGKSIITIEASREYEQQNQNINQRHPCFRVLSQSTF